MFNDSVSGVRRMDQTEQMLRLTWVFAVHICPEDIFSHDATCIRNAQTLTQSTPKPDQGLRMSYTVCGL